MDETSELVDAFFGNRAGATAIFKKVEEVIANFGEHELRVGKSQVVFRRRRGFAYIWLPDMYLRGPNPEAVLSIALPYELMSARFKEVVNPAPSTWMHHLEMRSPDELDDEAIGWLRQAYDEAA
jgi:hypothetical protein